MRATAVPRRARASCRPIAKAISRPLNHFAIARLTVTPAISLPRPNIAHPAYASDSDGLANAPESHVQRRLPAKLSDMAYVIKAAPPTISPTNIEPVSLTPQRSSSIPQTISPPKMHSSEYALR